VYEGRSCLPPKQECNKRNSNRGRREEYKEENLGGIGKYIRKGFTA